MDPCGARQEATPCTQEVIAMRLFHDAGTSLPKSEMAPAWVQSIRSAGQETACACRLCRAVQAAGLPAARDEACGALLALLPSGLLVVGCPAGSMGAALRDVHILLECCGAWRKLIWSTNVS